MAGRALLDTRAAAALLRGESGVGEALQEADEVYTSIVVVGELLYGARHSKNAASKLDHVAAFSAAIVSLRSLP